MSLRVRIRFDARDVELDLHVRDGETVAVVGENGSGKSTLVEAVAGLLQPDRGRIELDGRVLFERESASARATTVPAHLRATGLLTQEPSLFPHLDVLDNVAFGALSSGVRRADARRRARESLDLVGVGDLAQSRSTEVSGGEAQRIALARAVAAGPRLLLLDEPLAAVDVSARDGIRRALRRVLERTPALVVTHEVVDALLLADRAVVLATGRVVEDGPVGEVFSRPQTAFAAHLAGLELVVGRAERGAFTSEDGLVLPAPGAGRAPLLAAFPSGAVRVRRAGDGGRAGRGPDTQGDLHRVAAVEPRGALLRVEVAGVRADVPAASAARLAAGDLVEVTVDRDAVQIYPRRPIPEPERDDASILTE